MTNKEIIQIYKNMRKLNDICREVGVGRSNVLQNSCTKEKEQKVAEICLTEIIKAYVTVTRGD